MRRRRTEPESSVPWELRVFEWRTWGNDQREALHAWSRARSAYYKAHPDAWPNGLAMLAGFANVRAKLFPSLSRLNGDLPYPEWDEGR